MKKEDIKNLIILNVFGIITISIFLVIFYITLFDRFVNILNINKILLYLIFIFVLILIQIIPNIYFFIKKKPKIEPGEYKLDEIKDG